MSKGLAVAGASISGALVAAVTCLPTGRDNRTVETASGKHLEDYYFTVTGTHLSAGVVLRGLLLAAVVAFVVYALLGGLRRSHAPGEDRRRPEQPW